MKVEVREQPFRPWQELADHDAARTGVGAAAGATAVFVGTMRDFNQGDAVLGMHLEHYPGMTERELERICAEAQRRWDLVDTLVIHRVGQLRPADPIVLVAVWSAHRREAFEACRHIMEELKSRAPFWKREQLEQTSRWVEKNSTGY